MNNDSEGSILHFLDYWRVIRLRWSLVLIVFLLVVVSAGVVCYFLPREFYSSVVVQIQSTDAGLKIFGNERRSATGSLATEFQILRSKRVLYPVIESLDLQKKWSPPGEVMSMEEAFFRLRRKMERTQDIRDTELVEIGVYSTSAQEAADIANEVARSYQKVKEDDQVAIVEKELGELHSEIEKKRKSVDDAQKAVRRIAQEQGIIDLSSENLETAQTREEQLVTQEETQANELKLRLVELRTQLEQTESMTPEELMKALTLLNIADPTVSKIMPLYQDVSVEEARLLNSGFGVNHPRVKSLQAQKKVYQSQLGEQNKALRASLMTRLRVTEATLEALNSKLETSKERYQTSREQNVEYVNAKVAYVSAKRILEAAETRLETQRMQLGISIFPIKVWNPAEPSLGIARPNVIMYMSLAVAMGLGLGVAMVFFLEYLDTSVKSLEEAEKLLGVPVLAVIPKDVGHIINATGDTPECEAYRILQTNIDFSQKGAPEQGRTFTVISGGAGEGKSTTVNNLATTYARAGYRVLIVDADLRRASQHHLLGLSPDVGFVDVLTQQITLEEAVQPTREENLFLLACGNIPDEWKGILASRHLSEFIEYVKGHYDLIFFDSPPLFGLSDASVLVREVDACLMVIQYRRFPRSMQIRVKQLITQAGGNLIGVVLNRVDIQHDGSYQYYSQYYDYYQTTGGGKKAKSAPAMAAAPRRPGSGSSEDEY